MVAFQPLQADRIELRDGRVYEGKFLGVNERGELRIRTGEGIKVIPMKNIRSMRRGPARKKAGKPRQVRKAPGVPEPPRAVKTPGAAKPRLPAKRASKPRKEPSTSKPAASKPIAKPIAKPKQTGRTKKEPDVAAKSTLPRPGTKGGPLPRARSEESPTVQQNERAGASARPGFYFAALVPGLVQYRAGSQKKGAALFSGFTIALIGSYYFGERMRAVSRQANSDLAYHLNLNPEPDRAFRAAREGLLYSLSAGLLVYALHLGDWFILRIGLYPEGLDGTPAAASSAPPGGSLTRFEFRLRF